MDFFTSAEHEVVYTALSCVTIHSFIHSFIHSVYVCVSRNSQKTCACLGREFTSVQGKNRLDFCRKKCGFCAF